MHNWVTLLHTWNEYNFENQLYLTKKIFKCVPALHQGRLLTHHGGLQPTAHRVHYACGRIVHRVLGRPPQRVETPLHTLTRPFLQWGVRRLRRGPLPAWGSCQHDTEKATGSKVKVQKEKNTLLNSGMFILPLKKATRRSSYNSLLYTLLKTESWSHMSLAGELRELLLCALCHNL